ncbi:hypothetical protein PQX77_011669 [Marasmius sp. AFHP31]|nr:hypothetical protein PQX77_011669 [Marasmius sp. AFHP31]
MEQFDDTAPILVYSPSNAWEIAGVNGEYNSTTHGTRNAGAQMQFVFSGTGIDVYGTKSFNMSSVPVTNRFTVDNGDPVLWSASPGENREFNTKMFSSRGLDNETHLLVMEVMVENSETWIDYVQVVRAVPTSTLPPTVASTATSTSPSSPASTASSAASDAHSPLSAGAVAGMSIGATLAVVLAVLCLLLCLRQRRRRVEQASSEYITLLSSLVYLSYNPACSQCGSFYAKSRSLSSALPSRGQRAVMVEYDDGELDNQR